MKTLYLVALLSLSGCSTAALVTSALSSVATPGVSASLQIGDDHKTLGEATIGTKEESKVVSKVSGVTAQREVKVDSSSQKQDNKTEISEVRGDVQVTQGPSGGLLAFLASGWIALALLPLLTLWYLYRRSRHNGSS